MFDEMNRYVIRDYRRKPTFSSFLPGIAGTMGVPLWCYYNNRGQAVCSFGAKDRDHAIMEFSAAHVAYREVSRLGFRTFVKINGAFKELFTDSGDMHIGASEVEIRCKTSDLEASAVYFGLPNERCAGLVRIFSLKNISGKTLSLELLDGMPEVVSYGVNQDSLKNMPQLSKAWMRAEDYKSGLTCFRVRASMGDSARVTEVKGSNFAIALDDDGALLKPLVQPTLVFGEDTSLAVPEGFLGSSLYALTSSEQVAENCFPCCFFPIIKELSPGEEIKLYELYGQLDDKSEVPSICEKASPEWFGKKRAEAWETVSALTSAVKTKTADPVFDEYCRITYLDNVLRGGAPIFFEHGGRKKPFYVYSRKHGDPEREYNYFSLGGEYFAQGNGNFRDVNQNRRCDVLFAPELKEENIRTFFDLIQPDGYNPLVLVAATFSMPEEKAAGLSEKFSEKHREAARQLLSGSFTPGACAMAAESWGLDRESALRFTAEAVCESDSEPDANFQEGYWSDHWTYNLDLIESYLSVWPEDLERLVFGDRCYRWYSPRAAVRPRAERYVAAENGLRQYNAVYPISSGSKWAKSHDGNELRSTLIEKLTLLIAIKTATLDACGMGIEMEAGKPGWYDALNGLPGLLGSSTAESCELLRLIRFTKKAVSEHAGDVELYKETAGLLRAVGKILSEEKDIFRRWELLSDVRESYRVSAYGGYTGERETIGSGELLDILTSAEHALDDGINRAIDLGNGILPTYFSYDTENILRTPDGKILPKDLRQTVLPLFLEGPVHWLKLENPVGKKLEMVRKIAESGLYDDELKMYKVNESLAPMSFEAGRCKAFVPGWLENESIWLHMEYKYLLELLRSGLYGEFSEAFKTAAVPFMDPEVYGRSPLENVSFIASSANPDKSVHGRGFVARLSGSTAEFLQIRQVMFFGQRPFRHGKDGLELMLEPFIPDYLIPDSGRVEAEFLGNVNVVYVIKNGAVPGKNPPTNWKLTYSDGRVKEIAEAYLKDSEARAVRSGRVSEIEVTLG